MASHKSRTYRVGEFARLAGVTARTLHHYDRLGLLSPKRTRAGYRAYSERDLERLVQIIALKFVGIPLRQIDRLTATQPKALAAALHAQQRVLEDKRRLLDLTISAIGEAEAALRAGRQADATVYRRIIEVIEMQTNNKDWNAKYQELVDAKVARLKALSPEGLAELRRDWGGLVNEVRQALGEDPAGSLAQELASRWLDLLGRLMGAPVDPSMQKAAATHQGSGNWGPSEADKPVWDFINRALAVRQ